MTDRPHPYGLLDADDSVLIVIDVQEAFLDKLPADDSRGLLARVCWLITLAHWLKVPLVVTAEELPRQPLAARLTECLPADTPVFDKMVFGLADQPEILAAVKRTGRKTAILVGLETDVCVVQSALGLAARGLRVAVVVDAVGTPGPGQALGLERIKSAGAILVNMKSLFYEWLRTVEAVERFHRELPAMRELAGIVL